MLCEEEQHNAKHGRNTMKVRGTFAMNQRLAQIVVAVLILLLSTTGAFAQEPPSKPLVDGAVTNHLQVDATLLETFDWSIARIKWSAPNGSYRGSFEGEGISLHQLLDKAVPTKKAPDGFNRELDMFVLVTGKDGTKATFSYGEIYLGNFTGGIHLQRRWRYLFPHKHSPVSDFDKAAWLPNDATGHAVLKAGNCLACHQGERPPALSMPTGIGIVSLDDRWGGRVIEDVQRIEVRQSPPLASTTSDVNRDTMMVEEPTLVLPDGSKQALQAAALASFSRQQVNDCSFGEGKGFHGIHKRQGIPLQTLLAPHIKGVDPRTLCVLVTAADGYRSLFSGGEIFLQANAGNVLLIDQEDGQPLGPGQGRYRVFSSRDFYIDRCIRAVQEIRLFVP